MATKADKTKIILGAIKDNTKDWATEVFEVEDKMSPKAKKLSKILGEMSHSVADKDRMAEIVSELSGENVKIEKEGDLELKPLTAIVLTKVTDKHKHSYETDTVLVSLGDGTAVASDGKVGSPIPPTRQIMRPATEKEIESIPEAQLKGLMKEVNIVFA